MAEVLPYNIRQVPKCSGLLNDSFREQACGGLWPEVTVGQYCRKAVVGILGWNMSGSLRAPERIHPAGHNPPVTSWQQRSFERPLQSESCRMTHGSESAVAACQ